jgi:hypothetical protein
MKTLRQRSDMTPFTHYSIFALILTSLPVWAAENEATNPEVASPLPIIGVHAPAFFRIEVQDGKTAFASLPIDLSSESILIAVESECRCLGIAQSIPRTLPQGHSTLTLRVLGLLPGTKSITLRTTAGTLTTTVQVAIPGHADAQAILSSLAKEAAPEHLGVVAIVHDLNGKLDNCGCSTGSLGGAGYLARLPETLRTAGFTTVRCVLTGNVDGVHPGLGKALSWEVNPKDVLVSGNPAEALGNPEVFAVVDTSDGAHTPAHQMIVRPVLDGGAVAILLLVDGNGRIRSHHVLPIDRSLPEDSKIVSAFSETRTIRIDEKASPSTVCATCHTTAHTQWANSGHARAWQGLPEAKRVDSCVICHSTGQPGTEARAPAVQCTACHQGAADHAASPTIRTTGVTDCRSCHDAVHHPGFDRDISWELMRHGR